MGAINGSMGKTILGLSTLGGVFFGAAMIYGAAATIGIPLPRPAFNTDIKNITTEMEKRISTHEGQHAKLWIELRSAYEQKLTGFDSRLSRVERRQIESILVSLTGQLRQAQREITEATRAGRTPPESALREVERLRRQIRSYEQELFGRNR